MVATYRYHHRCLISDSQLTLPGCSSHSTLSPPTSTTASASALAPISSAASSPETLSSALGERLSVAVDVLHRISVSRGLDSTPRPSRLSVSTTAPYIPSRPSNMSVAMSEVSFPLFDHGCVRLPSDGQECEGNDGAGLSEFALGPKPGPGALKCGDTHRLGGDGHLRRRLDVIDDELSRVQAGACVSTLVRHLADLRHTLLGDGGEVFETASPSALSHTITPVSFPTPTHIVVLANAGAAAPSSTTPSSVVDPAADPVAVPATLSLDPAGLGAMLQALREDYRASLVAMTTQLQEERRTAALLREERDQLQLGLCLHTDRRHSVQVVAVDLEHAAVASQLRELQEMERHRDSLVASLIRACGLGRPSRDGSSDGDSPLRATIAQSPARGAMPLSFAALEGSSGDT